MVVTLISGIILGAPTLRVRGDYLAIVTLGFGEIVRLILVNADWLGGSARHLGHPARPPEPRTLFEIPHLDWSGFVAVVDLDTPRPFLQFGVIDSIPYYWLALDPGVHRAVPRLADARTAASAGPGRPPARTRTPPS